MSLSNQAQPLLHDVCASILFDPFMRELQQGQLAWERFSYYLEQDQYYLRVYQACLERLAGDLPAAKQSSFRQHACAPVQAEEETVYGYYAQQYGVIHTGVLTQATQDYTHGLMLTYMVESTAVAAATVLPCFWVYQQLGQTIQKGRHILGNRYQRWIEIYGSSTFAASTAWMIEWVDEFYSIATVSEQQNMLAQFNWGCEMERRFFNEAYGLVGNHASV